MNSRQAGLTLIEILIVLAILGILAALILTGIAGSQKRAHDTRIESSVNQLRYLAEIAYDNQGASYKDWDEESGVQSDIQILLEDIDSEYGDFPGAPYVTALRTSQSTDFCISAPLNAAQGSYACIDADGELQRTTAACPDYPEEGPLLSCP